MNFSDGTVRRFVWVCGSCMLSTLLQIVWSLLGITWVTGGWLVLLLGVGVPVTVTYHHTEFLESGPRLAWFAAVLSWLFFSWMVVGLSIWALFG